MNSKLNTTALPDKLIRFLGVSYAEIKSCPHPKFQNGQIVTVPKDSRSMHRFCVLRYDTLYPSEIERVSNCIKAINKKLVPIISAKSFSAVVLNNFNKRGWGFIDDSGNCFIRSLPLVITCEGLLPQNSASAKRYVMDIASPKARMAVRGLFSPKVLAQPFSHRTLVGATMNFISQGFAANIVARLVELEYVTKLERGRGFRLDKPLELIGDMASLFAHAPDFKLRYYENPGLTNDLARIEERFGANGKAALAAFSAIPDSPIDACKAYIRVHIECRDEFENLLNLNHMTQGGNLQVLYSRDPSALAKTISDKSTGCRKVNPIQTYWDLSCFGAEGICAAEELMDKTIRPYIQKVYSRSQTR